MFKVGLIKVGSIIQSRRYNSTHGLAVDDLCKITKISKFGGFTEIEAINLKNGHVFEYVFYEIVQQFCYPSLITLAKYKVKHV